MQGLSDDDLLSVDMDQYEHPDNLTQWAAVREAMLGGGRGQASLPVWSAIQREVDVCMSAWSPINAEILISLQEDYVLRNTTYSYAPIAGTPFTLVLVTPSDLWLLTTPTSLDNRTVDEVFIQFSSSPAPRGDMESGDRESGLRCLQRSEGRSHGPGLLSVLAGERRMAVITVLTLCAACLHLFRESVDCSVPDSSAGVRTISWHSGNHPVARGDRGGAQECNVSGGGVQSDVLSGGRDSNRRSCLATPAVRVALPNRPISSSVKSVYQGWYPRLRIETLQSGTGPAL